MRMDKEYEVKVTRQAMTQMKEIVHYISAELLAPEAADKLLDKMRHATLEKRRNKHGKERRKI